MKILFDDLYIKTKNTFRTKFFKEHNITYDNIEPIILDGLNTIMSRNITSDRKRGLFEMLLTTTELESDLVKRFDKYCETPKSSEINFRLKLGDEAGSKKFIESAQARGQGNTLAGQIAKYGIEEGTKRHEEMNSKKIHTLENFIRKHGEEKGKEMYELTMSKKGLTLDRMKEKYGDELGIEKFNDWKEKCISTKENFIKRHGEELGNQKWDEFRQKSKSTQENFIRRHGKTEGEKRWNSYKENYGWTRASEQSLEIFEPITKFLLENNISFDEIFYGVENSFEYKIENNNRLYSYDYTILPLKLIFEFNGNHVHPSKEKLGDKWNEWRNAWTGENADTRLAQDLEKISIAENKGFDVIEIWDFEDKKIVIEKCKELIKERI